MRIRSLVLAVLALLAASAAGHAQQGSAAPPLVDSRNLRMQPEAAVRDGMAQHVLSLSAIRQVLGALGCLR